MCGIIGYSGTRAAAPILLDSLRRLEYRGYDSAGIAVLDAAGGGTTAVVKSDRKVADLAATIARDGIPPGLTGIGHTRWATHGRPTVINAHPHRDCSGRLHIIHNGIIENFRELRAELTARGHVFESETDTEVVPHLIEDLYTGDLPEAVRRALARIQGAYALVIIHADHPGLIVGARLNAPLVVGLGDDEVFISSDITALIPYTKRVVLIGEAEVVAVTPHSVAITRIDGTPVDERVIVVDWEAEQAQKNGYPHFMLKEIHEQPDAVRAALRGRVDASGVAHFSDLGVSDKVLAGINAVTIIACGTAMLAGVVVQHAIEKLARIPVRVEPASEFRYSDPIVDEKTLIIAISQSGETADTMAAVREARRRGSPVIALTNVVGSALSLEADGVIYLQSGPEISVAATKTFTTQMACGYLLALHIADVRGTVDVERQKYWTDELAAMPERIERVLECEDQMAELAQRYARSSSALFIARGINTAIAYEGALKLKEVSYVHAEGHPAGELKHGPIALLGPDVPVIAIATESATLPKMVSSIQEVRSRDAPITALITRGRNPFDDATANDVVEIPMCDELMSPILTAIPLQLLAYHVAVVRGCDVDQPRNLAKSVTVE